MRAPSQIAFSAHLRFAIRYQNRRRNLTCAAAVRSKPMACARVGKKNAGEAAAITAAVNGGVSKDVAERIVANIQRARNNSVVSEFVPWNDAEILVRCTTRSLPFARSAIAGGQEDAERAVLVSAPINFHSTDDELIEDAYTNHLAAIIIRGEFERANVSQRDLLGAVLSNIDRRRVGDVMLGGDGAGYAILHKEIAEYLCSSLVSVGKVAVETAIVGLEEIAERERRVKEMFSVEKSTRIDAVGSAGFKISRSKMADHVRNGNVKVNQQQVKKVALNLGEGDVVSVRGLGRIEIGEINTTKKGNQRVVIRRYL